MQESPVAASDVVVTAERLRKLRLATTMDGGRLVGCAVRVSSGDAQVDTAACQAMIACAGQGVTNSEVLADCVDNRVAVYVQERANAPAEDK
jgi:hypothetical protein